MPTAQPLVVLNTPALLADTILACLCHRKLAENIGEKTAFDGALFNKPLKCCCSSVYFVPSK